MLRHGAAELATGALKPQEPDLGSRAIQRLVQRKWHFNRTTARQVEERREDERQIGPSVPWSLFGRGRSVLDSLGAMDE
jgi:hypothetical protein